MSIRTWSSKVGQDNLVKLSWCSVYLKGTAINTIMVNLYSTDLTQYDSELVATFLLNFSALDSVDIPTVSSEKQMFFDIDTGRFSDGYRLSFRVDLNRIGSVFDEEDERKEINNQYGDICVLNDNMNLYLPIDIWQEQYELVSIGGPVTVSKMISEIYQYYDTISYSSLNADGAINDVRPCLKYVNHLGEYIFFDRLQFNHSLVGWVLKLKSAWQISE